MCVLTLLCVLLSVGATFLARILRSYANDLTAIIVVGVYVSFLFFVAANAFDVIDVVGYLRLLAPKRTKIDKK